MKTILAIETSCDETAISIIQTNEIGNNFKVLSDLVISQIDIHAEYGGVFPAMAKREHAKNLMPLFDQALKEAQISESDNFISESQKDELKILLQREPELYQKIAEHFSQNKIPKIDIIMFTNGPGLAPALWVGVNFAKAIAALCQAELMPVNHMEGHISSILLKDNYKNKDEAILNTDDFSFPMTALLISGGHTQIVHIKKWGDYEILGETIDDAVGEAFDKVARMLGMKYPGGPKISIAAAKAKPDEEIMLPRPMLHSGDFRFSFSGLKTAARYLIQDLKEKSQLSEEKTNSIALEFEEAVTETLMKKTKKALEETGSHGLIIAGGVSANKTITSAFKDLCDEISIPLFLPEKNLCSDNAMMIASAGFLHLDEESAFKKAEEISAIGNLKL